MNVGPRGGRGSGAAGGAARPSGLTRPLGSVVSAAPSPASGNTKVRPQVPVSALGLLLEQGSPHIPPAVSGTWTLQAALPLGRVAPHPVGDLCL